MRAHTSIITAIGKPLVTVFLVFISQTGYGLEVRELAGVLNAQTYPYHLVGDYLTLREPYFHFSGLALH